MTVYLLNLLDLAFTLYALSHGATELNPLMRCVPVMIVYKTVVVGVLCRWLSRREVKLFPLAAVYGLVDLWHIWNLIL